MTTTQITDSLTTALFVQLMRNNNLIMHGAALPADSVHVPFLIVCLAGPGCLFSQVFEQIGCAVTPTDREGVQVFGGDGGTPLHFIRDWMHANKIQMSAYASELAPTFPIRFFYFYGSLAKVAAILLQHVEQGIDQGCER